MATRMREKAEQRRENAEKRPHATAKYIRVSTRKCKAVVDLIRGKSVREAEARGEPIDNGDADAGAAVAPPPLTEPGQ